MNLRENLTGDPRAPTHRILIEVVFGGMFIMDYLASCLSLYWRYWLLRLWGKKPDLPMMRQEAWIGGEG